MRVTKIINTIFSMLVFAMVVGFLVKPIDVAASENYAASIPEDIWILLEEELSIFSDDDWDLLTRVSVAEAGYNCPAAQQNVSYVVLNRMKSEKFPNSLRDVIYQNRQFDVVRNGAINRVTITEDDIKNIKLAYIASERYETVADGALFFARGMTSGREYLFTDEVGHMFCR